MSFFLYARVARAHTTLLSFVSIIPAFLYSKYHYGAHFNLSFLFVSAAILLFNLSANTISEYRDCVKGVDDIHSPGTKFRLVSGKVPRKHIYAIGLVSFLCAAICGICALCFGSLGLFIPGSLAAGITYFYSEKPFCLKYKAFGEVCVFLVYGPLLFSSCVISLTNQLSFCDIIFSIPFSLLTTCVLLANNIRDYEFEKGKTVTLPIKYGLKFAYFLIFSLVHLSFLFIPFFVFYNLIPAVGFSVFAIYPLLFLAAKRFDQSEFINAFGIIQSGFSLIICLSFLYEILIKS